MENENTELKNKIASAVKRALEIFVVEHARTMIADVDAAVSGSAERELATCGLLESDVEIGKVVADALAMIPLDLPDELEEKIETEVERVRDLRARIESVVLKLCPYDMFEAAKKLSPDELKNVAALETALSMLPTPDEVRRAKTDELRTEYASKILLGL